MCAKYLLMCVSNKCCETVNIQYNMASLITQLY